MRIDSHIHYGYPGKISDVIKALDITSCDKGNLVALLDSIRANETLDCLLVKGLCKNRIYSYGALDASLYYDLDKMETELVPYVDKILKCGCDGIKMLEGKPTCRKRYPIPNFDSKYYEPYFKYMEENNVPIVWHVNDPEEFWDEELCPDWAKNSGWLYDESFVNNIDQYNQIDNVLERHPNLIITFAHFYFLSNDLNKLEDMFNKYPNVRIDITPGIELFTNLSANIIKAKEFFNKYSDRIVYGTDISIYENEYEHGLNIKDSIDRANLCMNFLSKDKFIMKGDADYLLGKDDLLLNGLELSQDKIDNIMYKNFLNVNGEIKPLNIDLILDEIECHKDRIIKLAKYRNNKPDLSYLDEFKEMFTKLK